jgi:sulfate permease, SulP family
VGEPHKHERRKWPVVPVPVSLRGYQLAWLRGDLLAGITVAAFLVPQVMAYAQVAGVPPVAGLWAALPALVIYAVLGSSRSLSMGPESTTALMTAVAIGPLAAGSPARYAGLAASLALLVGVLSVCAGLARLGFVADLLSRPVLVGYLAGVGLIMIAGQLGRVTGVRVSGSSVAAELASFAGGLGGWQPATVAVAGAVLIFLFVVRWRWPHAPGPLLAMLLATVAVAAFGLSGHGVSVVGPIPAGLPVPGLPEAGWHELRELLLPAFSVMIVAFTDDVLTARSFARRGELVRANQELVALGVANAGASVLQGFPVSSSATRTAIAVAAGSRTQVYSLAAAASVLVVLYFLGPLLARFPVAALGAIVIYAAIRLIDVTAFRQLLAFRRGELVIALLACAGVLVFNILYGVLLAVAVSVAELLVRVARPHDAVLGRVPGLAGMHDVDDYPGARTVPGLVVYRYDAPLFFANAEDFRRRALAAADREPDLRWFVLNVEANVEVDFTALEAMDALREDITERGAVFALARVKQDLLARLEAFGLAGKIGTELLFPTLPTAMQAYQDRTKGPPAGNQDP